eukprot:m.223738 g.223738  ORF g.223738 m.223738 type:complete len:603 (-) comp10974_c0_seq1:1235-3043(-)
MADRDFDEEDEEDDVVLEEARDGQWRKMKKELPSSDGFRRSFVGYETDEGFMVQWNEMQISSKKSRKDREELSNVLGTFRTLQHDNIAKMFDFWFDKQNRLVYITELMTSGTLQQYLLKNEKNQKPIQFKVWQRWCLQMLSALKYLHKNGLPHSDLSSRNIHIQHNGQIKLGMVRVQLLSKYVQTMKEDTESKHMSAYLAPEACGAYEDPHTDTDVGAADVYAFGILALELLTLKVPYLEECSTKEDVFEKKASFELPASLANVTDERQAEFIRRCLLPASKRPHAAQLMFDPVLYSVPTLLQQAAHVYVFKQCDGEATQLEQDEKQELAVEAILERYRTIAGGPCTHTPACGCFPVHFKGGRERGWQSGADMPDFKEFLEIENPAKYLDEVKNRFHPLLFIKCADPAKCKDATDDDAVMHAPESRRLTDKPAVSATVEEEERQCKFNVTMKMTGEGGNLRRYLNFDLDIQPKLGEIAAQRMVQHCLLNALDADLMAAAIDAELLNHPRYAEIILETSCTPEPPRDGPASDAPHASAPSTMAAAGLLSALAPVPAEHHELSSPDSGVTLTVPPPVSSAGNGAASGAAVSPSGVDGAEHATAA